MKEAEELDIEIGQLKDAIQDVKSKNEDITGKYDLRQVDINEYREEQRILEEKRKFEEKQCNSAIRIQVYLRHRKYDERKKTQLLVLKNHHLSHFWDFESFYKAFFCSLQMREICEYILLNGVCFLHPLTCTKLTEF